MTNAHPDAVRLVAIRDTPLDVTEVVDALGDEGAGGLTLFIGQVRDHDGGKGVTALDYSAHPSALERLEDVCRRVAAEHDVRGVAAVHRVGELRIGDLAVVVATRSGHQRHRTHEHSRTSPGRSHGSPPLVGCPGRDATPPHWL